MRRLTILLLLCGAFLWLGYARPSRAIGWCADYEAALSRARQEDRLLLVHVTRPDRALAIDMDARTWTDAALIEEVGARFVALRLEGERDAKRLESWTACAGALACVVIDPAEGAEGEPVSARLGHARADELLPWLERVFELVPELRAARERAAADPHDLASALEAASLSVELGLGHAAETMLQEALAAAGEDADRVLLARCHAGLAHALVRRGEARAAREHCARARELDPGLDSASAEEVLLSQALVLSIERREREAAALLEHGCELFPRGALRLERLLALARVRHHSGDTKGAVASLELLQAELAGENRPAFAALREAARLELEHVANPPADHTH